MAEQAEQAVNSAEEESDIESDEEPIDIPPFGLDEVAFLDFNEAKDRVSDSVTFGWQRGSQPHRQTIWRQKKQARELESAAHGSADIRRFFAPPAGAGADNIPPTNTANAPLGAADAGAGAADLDEPATVVVQSRQTIQEEALIDIKKALRAKRNPLIGQTRRRYDAVQMFLSRQIQCARKGKKFNRRQIAGEVAESIERGSRFARYLISWEREWISNRTIPEGRRGLHSKIMSIFNDEDVALFVREFVAEKGEKVTAPLLAKAVTEYLGSRRAGESIQTLLENVPANDNDVDEEAVVDAGADAPNTAATARNRREGIKIEAARQWLRRLGYSWRGTKKTVYFDGHERPDVVVARQLFVSSFLDLEPRFARWNDEGELMESQLPEGEREIVVVTHDESTFHTNDGRRQMWLQDGKDPIRPKTMGRGIMVSDFLTPVSRLRHKDNNGVIRHATHLLEYGPDNYWTGQKMLEQVLNVMLPLFEQAYPPQRYQGLFIFDNATNHCVMADDALVAKKMNLGAGGKQPVMRDGWYGEPRMPQRMWELEDGGARIAKGIKKVLQERNL